MALTNYQKTDVVELRDQSGDPSNSGEIQRNGSVLKFHDGTAARTLGSDGKLLVRYIAQASQPTPEAGELLIWNDQADYSGSTWLVVKDKGNNNVRKVQLT